RLIRADPALIARHDGSALPARSFCPLSGSVPGALRVDRFVETEAFKELKPRVTPWTRAAKAWLAMLAASPTRLRRTRMNNDIIAGKWLQLKGKAQAKWGDLTDDVFDVAAGDSKYLAGKLQERYGWDRDRAEREVDEFGKTLD